MADTTTTTYSLTKPEVGASEDTWGTKINTNLDALDDLLDGTSTLLGPKLNSNTTLVDVADGTKVAQFTVSGITTATTRTFTLPDASGTFVLADATQTLTNKALTSPTINTGITFDGVTLTGTSGADVTLVSGTAGTSGNLIQWNADGDAVDSGVAASAVTAPALEFIESQDAASDATLDFTGFDATRYDSYQFFLSNVVPVTDNVELWLRTSSDGGSTFDSSTAYSYGITGQDDSTTAPTGNGSPSSAAMVLTFGTVGVGSDANEHGVSGVVNVYGPHLAQYTNLTWHVMHDDSGTGWWMTTGMGARKAAADVDAVRFLFSSGSIESGTITMYGLRNS